MHWAAPEIPPGVAIEPLTFKQPFWRARGTGPNVYLTKNSGKGEERIQERVTDGSWKGAHLWVALLHACAFGPGETGSWSPKEGSQVLLLMKKQPAGLAREVSDVGVTMINPRPALHTVEKRWLGSGEGWSELQIQGVSGWKR